MMTRRERLMATLRGEAVDRPAVNFYEIGGFKVDPADPDPFNIYNSPSWQPLLEMAKNETDIIRMCSSVRPRSHEASETSSSDIRDEFMTVKTYMEDNSRMTRTAITVGGRTLTSLTKRNPGLDTLWTVEHLFKNNDDVRAYLELPDEFFAEKVDVAAMIEEEQKLGDSGIVMVDTEDPVCAAANLFSMEDFTVFAMLEKTLCHQLLEKCSRYIYQRTEQASYEFPGRLWRIYGPEYVTPPYLAPNLFNEYVVRYDLSMIEMIHKYNGFVRIHSHGNLRDVLPYIIKMGADAIDPIEPPAQGDVELDYVRREYGQSLVLFGNLEITDIENMEPDEFSKVVAYSLEQGTSGVGRGFVLMPSASPYGRDISERTMKNYRTMIELTKQYAI